MSYFQDNFGCKTSVYQNPADVYMQEISLNYPKRDEDFAKIEKMTSVYAKHQAPKIEEEMAEFTIKAVKAKKRHEAPFSV